MVLGRLLRIGGIRSIYMKPIVVEGEQEYCRLSVDMKVVRLILQVPDALPDFVSAV